MANRSTLTVAGGEDAGELSPQPFLFVVLDSQDLFASSSRHSLAGLNEVTLGRGEPGASRSKGKLHIGIPNGYVSTLHATLRHAAGRWHVEDSSKNGTFVNGVRVDKAILDDGDMLELAGAFLRFRETLDASEEDLGDVFAGELRPPVEGLLTLVPALHRAFEQLERIARSPVSVVLRGETGSGKEVIARAIHTLSRRRGEFIAVNCGAIPATLIESELFGYKKGAFSGATEDRPGLIRAADRGTLLLDEVGDLPLQSQAALLRVLQEREVVPVGATRAIAVDLRVVAASHHDLRALVAEKKFRADLEARLSGIEIDVPPLRERREDLGILIRAILQRVLPDLARDVAFEKSAARALFRHAWPKNIRELEQALTSAVVLAAKLPIGLKHLPAALRARRAAAMRPHAPPYPVLEELVKHLEAERGNVSAVARALGKPRKQVQRWLKRHALDPTAYRRK